jgi:penicillin-binding protein 2
MKQSAYLRFLLFLSGVIGIFSLLVVRVADLQMVHGETYLHQAEDNRFYTQIMSGRRGVLLDRYEEPLVWNIQKYYKVENPKQLYENKKPISRDEALQLMASTSSAEVVTGTERMYRYPLALAHTVGYVGEVTAEDLQRNPNLKVGQLIGKAGLEFTHEKELKGKDGKEVFEVDALAQKLRKVSEEPAQPGSDIHTTIDPYLSEVAAKQLQGHRGTIIVTDVETGKILALTSQPAFDPNLLSQTDPDSAKEALRRQQVQALFNDPNQLFFNRAISGAFPPGSIFKIVTATAGLEFGKVNSSTQVVDEGVLKVGEFEFGNWFFRQYGRTEGSIDLVRAIARSNDIFFYKVAEWVGPNDLASTARLFGLGEKTGIDLPAETRGLVPDPDWKQRVKNEKWFLGDTYHVGIGQGDLLTSPIQIAQLTQAVGNYGKLCKVSLSADQQPECREVGVKDDDLRMVLDGMIRACSPGGTAFPMFPYNAQHLVEGESVDAKLRAGVAACKTGTAEFGAGDTRGYKKTHAWFTMLVQLPDLQQGSITIPKIASGSAETTLSVAGVDDINSDQLSSKWREHIRQKGFPRRIAITALVESDEENLYQEGSTNAAPLARDMLYWMLNAAK